jgi:hypothetical protein
VIPADEAASYPALADDLVILRRHVAHHFRRQDETALRSQNRYRGIQVARLLVSAPLAGLGGLQAVWQDRRGPGILLAVLGAVVVSMTRWTDESQVLRRFLTARLKAERLRALHFQFLSRAEPFADDSSREAELRRAVMTIAAAKDQRPICPPDATSLMAPFPDARPDRATQFHQLYRSCRIVGQKNFYTDRCEEYLTAHDQAVVLRNVLLLSAAIAALTGQLFSGTGRAGLSVLAALFVTVAGSVTGYESLIGFSQLAKVYGDAAVALETAQITWDGCAPAGDSTALMTWVEEAITRENGQWGQLTAGTEPLVPRG